MERRTATRAGDASSPPTGLETPVAGRGFVWRASDAEAAYLAGQVGVTSPGHLSPAEAAKWADLRKEIKAAAVDEVVRYCVLKSASGVGLIDEAELKKVPALCTLPGVNVRAALVAADAELQSVFGMRLVVTWKRYVIDSAHGVDAVKPEFDRTKYVLQPLPSKVTCATRAHLVMGSVDGFTDVEFGCLALVLAFIMLEPKKLILEDVLFQQLQETDPVTFSDAPLRGHELRDGEEEEEEEEPVRQCAHWRSLISTTFVKCGYIDRRQVDADTAETLTQVESTQSGSVTGATRKGFQLGPRARQVIGLPTVLALIESIRGSSIRPDELHIAYGREDGFVQYALDVEPEDGVVVLGNPILAAGAAAGRR